MVVTAWVLLPQIGNVPLWLLCFGDGVLAHGWLVAKSARCRQMVVRWVCWRGSVAPPG
jgi:hypothetical protein